MEGKGGVQQLGEDVGEPMTLSNRHLCCGPCGMLRAAVLMRYGAGNARFMTGYAARGYQGDSTCAFVTVLIMHVLLWACTMHGAAG